VGAYVTLGDLKAEFAYDITLGSPLTDILKEL